MSSAAAGFIAGALMLAVGILVLTRADKFLEALILSVSPDWLVELTVGY